MMSTSNLPEKPADLLPIGLMIKLGLHGVRATVEEHVYDIHALGGWGYRLKYPDGISCSGFLWPHDAPGSSTIAHLHPLEMLARQAE